MPTIAVYAEIEEGAVNDVSLQCLTLARGLAGADGKVMVMAAGAQIAEAAARLYACGADAVHMAETNTLAEYLTRPYRLLVADWLRETAPAAALFPATTLGLDLAASVAAVLKAPCALYADAIQSSEDGWQVKRIEFDRKVATYFVPAKPATPFIAAVRDGAAEAAKDTTGRTGEVIRFAPKADLSGLARVLKRDVAKKSVNLKDARIIVAAGAGVGSREHFHYITELAEALGAQIGATRAVVDAGWLPADHQIGQTGATVKPEIYIGCGVSGAVQHRVGMMDAGKIVAINTDPNAPIFKIAHYKIVGDLKTVIPKLIQALKG